jgi:hypothetical protein
MNSYEVKPFVPRPRLNEQGCVSAVSRQWLELVRWSHRTSLGVVAAWVLVSAAAATGATMIAIGMIDELPGIIRGACARAFGPRRS